MPELRKGSGREAVKALERLGFRQTRQRGSHCAYHHTDGRLLTIVRPHGRRKTCHPADIRKLLEVLGL